MPPEPLEKRVLHFIQKNGLTAGQEKLVVAVSGGPDSVCLLHILAKLQKELKLELHIAHLNHELRGADSEADAHYVQELSRRLNLAATVERQDVRAYRAQHRLSLEEAAREVRYAFLARVAESIGASRAAVGHTSDDHIETILMHLIRGTGSRGLRGLQPQSQWQTKGHALIIIRPLLQVGRQETTEYCQRHQLAPRIDMSNLSLSPLRNRVRLQLLPLLRSYNPRIVDALLRTARIVADDLAFIDEQADRLWDSIARKQENVIILNKERFLGLPAVLQRHLLLLSLKKLLGNLRDIEMRHVEAVLSALNKPAGKRLNLPGDLVFAIDYDQYLIGDYTALAPFPALEGVFPLNIPGETQLPGWRVEATLIAPEAMGKETDNFRACLDFDRTGASLTVRSRQTGDWFQPLGMSQPKKVGEFMIDAKVPRPWRQRIPIISSPEQIVWVVGWRIDERVKVTPQTRRGLCLSFVRS